MTYSSWARVPLLVLVFGIWGSQASSAHGCLANSEFCEADGSVTHAAPLLQSATQTGVFAVQAPEVNVNVADPVVLPIMTPTAPRATSKTPEENKTKEIFSDYLAPLNGSTANEKEGVFPENEKMEEELEEHHSTGYLAILFLFTTLAMGVGTSFVLERYLPWLPFTCVLFVEGLAIAFMQPSSWDSFEASVALWERADPHLLIFVFLPPLVFGEAMSLNVTLVKKCFWQCMLLAGPGVIMGTAMIACVGKYMLPYNWDWSTAMLFGSILSATDPVAVVAIFNSLGVSPRLTMLVSGESLFNDGTAIVAFGLCMKYAAGAQLELGDVARFFWWMTTMGPLFGALLGFVAVWFLGLSEGENYEGDKMSQVVVLFVCAYMSFFIAESELQSSGVLTLVTCGFIVASYAWPRFIDRETIHTVWHMIEFVGNTVIFVLAGLIFGGICINAFNIISWLDVVSLVVLYVSSMVIRAIMFLILWLPMNLSGHRVTWAEGVVIVWAGMRGAVGLLMAVIADRSPVTSAEDGTRIMFHVGGTAALMLVINGPAMPVVLRYVGLMRTTSEQKRMLEKERFQLAAYTQHRLTHLMTSEETESLFSRAVKDRVEMMMPLLNVPRPPAPKDVGDTINKRGLALLRASLLRVVKATYWKMLDEGVLTKKSRVAKALLDSADLGLMQDTRKLTDFDVVKESLQIGYFDVEEDYRQSMWSWGAILNGDLFEYLQHLYGAFENYQERCINATLAFIHAHKAALDDVVSFLGTDERDRTKEQTQLMQEAEEQVRDAKSFLDSMPAESISMVQSKMLVAKLLHDQAHQVTELAESGVITSAHKAELEHELYMMARQTNKLTLSKLQTQAQHLLSGTMSSSPHGHMDDDED